jgi:hypothetical protein
VGRAERVASLIILAVLAVIAVGVGLRQASFNPAVLIARDACPSNARSSSLASASAIPSQLEPLGAAESFNADNLYDKIDGKAELYLAAGFGQMHCQRFALKDTHDLWFEWFVYEMHSLPSAFSVFTTQRRAEGQPLKLANYAYRTQNAVYLVSGSNYVEAVASDANERLVNAVLEMASAFVASDSSSHSRISELDLFPEEDLLPNSQTLQIADAFGFDGLRNVFTARYRINEVEATAFLTTCSSPTEAAHVRDAYAAFLLGNGGKELNGGSGSERRVEIMDGTELLFSAGNLVAGVHGASSLKAAEVLAQRLRDKLPAQTKPQ